MSTTCLGINLLVSFRYWSPHPQSSQSTHLGSHSEVRGVGGAVPVLPGKMRDGQYMLHLPLGALPDDLALLRAPVTLHPLSQCYSAWSFAYFTWRYRIISLASLPPMKGTAHQRAFSIQLVQLQSPLRISSMPKPILAPHEMCPVFQSFWKVLRNIPILTTGD